MKNSYTYSKSKLTGDLFNQVKPIKSLKYSLKKPLDKISKINSNIRANTISTAHSNEEIDAINGLMILNQNNASEILSNGFVQLEKYFEICKKIIRVCQKNIDPEKKQVLIYFLNKLINNINFSLIKTNEIINDID